MFELMVARLKFQAVFARTLIDLSPVHEDFARGYWQSAQDFFSALAMDMGFSVSGGLAIIQAKAEANLPENF